MKFKLISICIMSILLSGCVTSAYFYDNVGTPEAPNQVNIYQDFTGDIYPTTGVNSQLKPRKKQSVSVRAHLKDKLCKPPQATSGTDVDIACLVLRGENNRDEEWREFQENLWKQKASDIYKKANDGGKNRPIVFLISGFNNTAEEAGSDYEVARIAINLLFEKEEEQPIFVNVHWDGFKSTGIAGKPRAWLQAQASGPLVGYNLRFLMNELENKYGAVGAPPPIRMLTHSSGAFIVGAIIGDPSIALPYMQNKKLSQAYAGRRYVSFKEHAKTLYIPDGKSKYAIPQFKDFRIGMLAAATASNTFTDEIYLPERCPTYHDLLVGKKMEHCIKPREDKLKGMNLRDPLGILSHNVTLIIGYNRDEVITKFGLISTKSSIGGATGLGADDELYCRLENFLIARNVKTPTYKATSVAIDMRRTPPDDIKAHDFELYLSQPEAKLFYRILMDKDVNYDEAAFMPCYEKTSSLALP